MADPNLIPTDILAGISVGISVSDSADLARLGLTARHAELAIGEIGRGILLAGGRVMYGGRIRPSGFTQTLMHEVRRYGKRRHSITICLPYPEHRKLSLGEIQELDRSLGTRGRIECLDAMGEEIDPQTDRGLAGQDVESPEIQAGSLRGLRVHIARKSHARVVVGGQLAYFKGVMPGVLEEVLASVRVRQPIYLAGGFGGAAAAAVRALGIDDFEWASSRVPEFDRDDRRVTEALEELRRTARETGFVPTDNGLDLRELQQLAASHRPGDLASLVVIGLSRISGSLLSPGNRPR